jgi:hypothetical protein
MSPRPLLLALAGIASPALAVAGCDYYVAAANQESVSTVENLAPLDGGDAGDAATASGDAAPQGPTTGSPLCGATTAASAAAATCDPDTPTTMKACGVPDAQGDDSTLACRIVPAAGANTSSGMVQAVCAPAGTGGDGTWCKTSAECAATYDCVGPGTCQHYCCGGNMECVASEFCDIQPTTQTTGLQIPVCMPIQPAAGCDLLGETSECPDMQTCSVVRENGATSCVAVGAQKAGEACDSAHCAAGLVCLGTPGSRSCYQLCHTAMPAECSTSQTCKGGLPLFPDLSIGICQ